MKYSRALSLVCRVLLWIPFAAGGAHAAELSLAQEVQAGRGFVNAFVEQYGVSDNQRYRDLADGVVQELARASGERPELQWRVVVLKYNKENPVARNASAFPGGHIVTDEEFFKLIEAGAVGDPARMRALTAGVLAHEMAHIIRHDTDALVPAFLSGQIKEAPKLLFTLKSREGAPKENAAETRTKENECDRHGAFYLLRAGYRVDDMIGVFRHLASEEVDEVLFSSELDHARATERVGNLLAVGNLVANDERLYDEAVNILRLGLDDGMLRVAEQNLDVVSARFPKILPIRHARAVLAHRRYLLMTQPETLQFKPSFSFYRFRASRALPSDYLQQAIAEYEAILKDYEAEGHKGLGPTAAAYALALAQAGQADKAITWAQKAVALAPDDWNGYNVLAVALGKKGMKTEAVEQARKALALAAPEGPRALVERALLLPSAEERAVLRYVESQPPVEFEPALFNLGVLLESAGDKVGAAQAFQGYVAADPGSDWSKLARKHLKGLGMAEEPPAVPPVSGVRLGLSDIQLRKAVGNPEGIVWPKPGSQVWRYTKSKGMSIFLDQGNRVRAAVLSAPYAQEVGAGVKIGVAPAQVAKAWGKPIALASAGGREGWAYPQYGLTFLMDAGKLQKIVWSPAPPSGGAMIASTVQIHVEDPAAQVAKALGPADDPKVDPKGGVWSYDRLGVRVRFDNDGRVALVTLMKPSDAQVGGVKLGDAAAVIRQRVGIGFVTSDVENAETCSFPDRGVAYIIRNSEIATITLFPKQG